MESERDRVRENTVTRKKIRKRRWTENERDRGRENEEEGHQDCHVVFTKDEKPFN